MSRAFQAGSKVIGLVGGRAEFQTQVCFPVVLTPLRAGAEQSEAEVAAALRTTRKRQEKCLRYAGARTKGFVLQAKFELYLGEEPLKKSSKQSNSTITFPLPKARLPRGGRPSGRREDKRPVNREAAQVRERLQAPESAQPALPTQPWTRVPLPVCFMRKGVPHFAGGEGSASSEDSCVLPRRGSQGQAGPGTARAAGCPAGRSTSKHSLAVQRRRSPRLPSTTGPSATLSV